MAGMAALGLRAGAGWGAVSFDREIQPILSDHCFACHGPDASARKAGLRLDLEDAAKAPLGKDQGAAIVPGDPAASLVLVRMLSPDPDDVMPPPDSHKPLSRDQIDTVRQWIADGASWARHWAFEPPAPADRTADADPAVHPIDRLVREALAERDLAPAPRADRRALIRRLSLDLTGLPPSPEDIDAFVSDDRSDAYERLVDRLLASPRYGEHMARFWLDAVRYADTHGFHFDNYREIWPFRDWVVEGFNRNLPYDQFSTWQLAGDLLSDPSDEQRIATGYLRCNPTTNEGGIIDEEYRVEYAVDRVNNFGTVWLGLTVSCAQCHEHKFDPISQEEYFRLLAFFDDTTEAVRDGNKKDPAPVLKVPQPDQRVRLAEIQASLADLDGRLFGPRPDLDADQAAWEAELAAAWTNRPVDVALGPWFRMGPFSTGDIDNPYAYDFGPEAVPFAPNQALDGQRWTPTDSLTDEGGSFTLGGERETMYFARTLTSSRPVWVPVAAGSDDAMKVWLNGRVILDRNVERGLSADDEQFSLRLEAGDNHLLAKVVNQGGAGGFAMRIKPAEALGRAEEALVGSPDAERGTREGTWRFESESAPLRTGQAVRKQESNELVQHFYIGDPSGPTLRDDVSFFAWVYLDPDNPPRGIMLQFNDGNWNHRAYWGEPNVISFGRTDEDAAQYRYLGPLPKPGSWVRLEVDAGTVGLGEDKTLQGIAFTQQGGLAWWADAGLLVEDPQEALARYARLPMEERSEEQRRNLLIHYRRQTLPDYVDWEQASAALVKERTSVQAAIPVTLVAMERDKPMETRVLERGQYDRPGQVVTAGTPAALPAWPANAPTNRLGLAQWLFQPDHPLTARVAANRFWQQLFGIGLVKTPGDLGVQGERPLYPGLLDTLAVRFEKSGWDIKALMKWIVMSDTYAQASGWSDPRHRDDPENRWLARGPRFRMDAETIRDNALWAAGLLVERQGGPPVKPYQPGGLWRAVAYESSDTADYKRDAGDALYRRSLYTFWKRTSPPSSLRVLDAPSREFCVVRRERTNTPLAALALMNDTTFVEAARNLAERTLLEQEEETGRLARMFERTTGRLPRPPEMTVLTDYLGEQRAVYAGDRDRALALLAAGESPRDESLDPSEHAAWTMVASLLLNLDETLNKG